MQDKMLNIPKGTHSMADAISLPEPGMISMIDDDNAFLMVHEAKHNLHALLKKGIATI